MVSAANKKRMEQFICDRIEESGRYTIHTSDVDSIIVAQRSDLVDDPLTVNILLLNRKRTLKEWREEIGQSHAHGWYTGSIFYKDHRTFHMRLAHKGDTKKERSLKRYTKEQRNRMLNLRGLERKVLSGQSSFPGANRGHPELTYYQPHTVRLAESLRTHSVDTVKLDYSHLSSRDPGYGFARDGNSSSWGLLDERAPITGALGFRRTRDGRQFVMFREVEVLPMHGPKWEYPED